MADQKHSKNAYEVVPGATRRSRYSEVQHADDFSGTLKRLFFYFADERALVGVMFAVVVVGTIASVIAPGIQSNAIDILAGERDGILGQTVALMLTAYLFYSVSTLLQGFISAKLSQNIVKKLRDELFAKIVELPVPYLDTHSHGDIMSRMTNDVENISTTVSQALPSLCSGVLTLVGTISVMIWYCWQLALLSCITVFLTVGATKFLSKRVRKYSRSRQKFLGNLNGTVEEMIGGYRTVVAYNHQDETIDEFCKTADELTKAGIKTDIYSGVTGPVMNCVSNIGFVIIAAFGGWFALKGYISVGVISAFIVYAKQFSRPVNEIAQVYGQLQTAIAGAERVFAVLDEKSEDMSGETVEYTAATAAGKSADDKTSAASGAHARADITFDHVNFSYVKDHPVIRDFSLTVPSGKKVALVGATGSGKTTVVNLLMRFYDIDSGTIRINDRDITTISRENLRHDIAIVLQDTVLFADSVRNNLKYSNENASDEDLMKALRMSRGEELIGKMSGGLNAQIASGGANLSQGQRQLLAIARAFVADPKILILDEATSNVDTRTEKAIQDAMHRIMQDRTSIVIAHRLSTIQDADLIVVMDQGQIVESGTHPELLAKKKKYYELYMTQFAGIAT